MSEESFRKEKGERELRPAVNYASNRLKRQQMYRLQEAFQAINEDSELAKEFVEAPLEVMKKFDVNTTNLKINRSEYGAKIPPTNFGGVFQDKMSLTVCASLGVVLCVSVGDEF